MLTVVGSQVQSLVGLTACSSCHSTYTQQNSQQLHAVASPLVLILPSSAKDGLQEVQLDTAPLLLMYVCRNLGHVGFRLRLLNRHGIVVSVPYRQGRSSPESMACDIQAVVAAQTGRSLESWCG